MITPRQLCRAVLAIAAVALPCGEWAAQRWATATLARCGDGTNVCGALADLDVDVLGVRMTGVERELAGARWSAAELRIGVDAHGIAVDVHDPQRAPSERASGAAAASPERSAARRRSPRIDLHGIPAAIRVHGELAVALPRGIAATLVDPRVHIDSTGTPRAATRARVQLPGGHEIAMVLRRLAPDPDGGWHLEGAGTLDEGMPVEIDGTLDAAELRVSARAGPDAAVEIVWDRAASVTATASAWPLATLGPRIATLSFDRGLAVSDATIDGTVTLVLASAESPYGPGAAVHGDVVLRGVGVDDPRVAPRPIRLRTLTIDGDLERTGDGWRGHAELAHDDARVTTTVALAGDRLTLTAELAPLPCQALVDALPDGMADAIAGARLDGSIAGALALEVDLARRRTIDLDVDGPPGALQASFPFLESCRTTADPAGIDLAALAGPYRHVFVAGGRRHDRVLAPGAPGFVPLARAELVASAFVALEDMRYWSHDGFDRDQIARAFWHNLVAGRVRRGASTISQQAARNLWLGVDRSLARKLQEAYLTARLEQSVDKRRILELYVNLVELGPGVFGIDEAARFHFGVDVDELDALQAVHLASLAPAPRSLSKRFAGGEVDEAWMTELREHVRRMHRNGMISDEQLYAALRAPLRLRVRGPVGGTTMADAAP